MINTSMRRRCFLTALATAPLWTGPFVRRARAAEFVFKVAHPLAATHPTNIRLQQAADSIAKDSDGRLELRLFPNGQLGGEVDMLNQVRSGAIEMYVIGGLVISAVVPIAALDGTGFRIQRLFESLAGTGRKAGRTHPRGPHERQSLRAGNGLGSGFS